MIQQYNSRDEEHELRVAADTHAAQFVTAVVLLVLVIGGLL